MNETIAVRKFFTDMNRTRRTIEVLHDEQDIYTVRESTWSGTNPDLKVKRNVLYFGPDREGAMNLYNRICKWYWDNLDNTKNYASM